MERLVEALARDGHTGYVEIALRNGPSSACLFMDDGETVDAVLADESHAESGLSLVPTILKAVAAGGATLHVWKAAGLAAREQKPAEPPVPQPVPVAEGPVAPVPAEELEDLGETWAAILAAVEGVVDGVSEPGQFSLVLREVQREHAKPMPYLDPEIGLFEYRDGRVRFHQAPPGNFTRAMGDCLGDAIARISFRLRKADLETLIHRELAAVLEARSQSIARHGINRSASSFLAA